MPAPSDTPKLTVGYFCFLQGPKKLHPSTDAAFFVDPEPTQQTQAGTGENHRSVGSVLIQVPEPALLERVMPPEGLGNASWVAVVKMSKEEGTFAIPLCSW